MALGGTRPLEGDTGQPWGPPGTDPGRGGAEAVRAQLACAGTLEGRTRDGRKDGHGKDGHPVEGRTRRASRPCASPVPLLVGAGGGHPGCWGGGRAPESPGRREAPSPGVSSTPSPRGPAPGGRRQPARLLPPAAPGSPDPAGVRGARRNPTASTPATSQGKLGTKNPPSGAGGCCHHLWGQPAGGQDGAGGEDLEGP